MELLFILISLFGIVKSADYFIDQSISLAKKFRLSSFVIGFTVVAFGTSLPELVISLYSSYTGHTAIAVSNVIGSNITNICLILGLLAIYRPFKLSKSHVFYNIPLNLIALIVFIVVAIANNWILTPISGLILLIAFITSLFLAKNTNPTTNLKSVEEFNIPIFILALVGLIFFGKICVDNIMDLSIHFGIRESVLGYFIVAIGTSLPELVASFAAIRRGHSEIGIGSILGSNLFNLLFILGTATMIRHIDLASFALDIGLLLFITIILVLLAIVGRKYYLTKREGVVLLVCYVLFAAIQIL